MSKFCVNVDVKIEMSHIQEKSFLNLVNPTYIEIENEFTSLNSEMITYQKNMSASNELLFKQK